ncbi:hypothetical protein ACIRU3_43575 [Streptomyces sp. NPDC101151]|uniref:hypothetical protein n=1 Tax=Streptomyces sp. NPDC101151 TaxID=3366115 RepID=UPI00382790F2
MVAQQMGGPVHEAQFLALGPGEREELVQKAGGAQAHLPGVGTDVVGAVLRT